MAVSSTDFVVSYNANGVLVDFAFAFKIIAQTDLKVYEETAASSGLFTLKTLSTHYTVVFDSTAETGTVTFLSAPGDLKRVVITRDTPDTQATNLDIEGRSPAKTLEGMVDKVTLLAQEALEKLSRAILFRVAPVDPAAVDIDPLTDRRALIAESNGDGTFTIVPSVYDPDTQVAAAAASATAAASSATSAASSATAASASATAAAASAALAATLSLSYASGTIAARSAAPATNQIYYATDTGELAIYITTAARWFTLG